MRNGGGVAVDPTAIAFALNDDGVATTATVAATVDAVAAHAIPVEHGCVADGFILPSQALLDTPNASTHSTFRTWTPAPHETEHYVVEPDDINENSSRRGRDSERTQNRHTTKLC